MLAVAAPLAVGCSESGCNGLNAYDTNCAGRRGDSWQVLDVAYLTDPDSNYTFGYVQLYWSWTCGTNWARYVCQHASNCPTL